MDCKKFMQLVEEKKKRALEKKESPLKWEQKLEAAARAKTDAGAKERKMKTGKHKRRSVSGSDSVSDSESSDEGRKSTKRTHRKHSKHTLPQSVRERYKKGHHHHHENHSHHNSEEQQQLNGHAKQGLHPNGKFIENPCAKANVRGHNGANEGENRII